MENFQSINLSINLRKWVKKHITFVDNYEPFCVIRFFSFISSAFSFLSYNLSVDCHSIIFLFLQMTQTFVSTQKCNIQNLGTRLTTFAKAVLSIYILLSDWTNENEWLLLDKKLFFSFYAVKKFNPFRIRRYWSVKWEERWIMKMTN